MDKRVKCVFPNFIFFAFIFLIIKSALIFIFCIEIDRYMPTFWFWGPAHGSIWKFCKINDVLIIKKIFLVFPSQMQERERETFWFKLGCFCCLKIKLVLNILGYFLEQFQDFLMAYLLLICNWFLKHWVWWTWFLSS